MSPLAVLARGYAIATTEDGRAIRVAAEVTPGEEVSDSRASGRVFGEVSKRSAKDAAGNRLHDRGSCSEEAIVTPRLRFAVFGHPIAHCVSPAMHKAALKALGLTHTYEAVDIGDLEHLHSMVDALRQGIFAGVNVTVPYKRAVIDHGRPGRSQRRRRWGWPTRWCAAAGASSATTPTPRASPTSSARSAPSGGRRPSSAGGGGARAAVAACMALGANVVAVTQPLVGRQRDAGRLGHRRGVSRDGRAALRVAHPRSDSAGGTRKLSEVMRLQWADIADERRHHHPGDERGDEGRRSRRRSSRPSFRGSASQSRRSCYDLVYNPRETPFLQGSARARSCATREGSACWPGKARTRFRSGSRVTPDVDLMRLAAERALLRGPPNERCAAESSHDRGRHDLADVYASTAISQRARSGVAPHQRRGRLRELDHRADAHAPLPRPARRGARSSASPSRDPLAHGRDRSKSTRVRYDLDTHQFPERGADRRLSVPHPLRSRSAPALDLAARRGRFRADAGAGARAERGGAPLRLARGRCPSSFALRPLLALRPFHALVREHGSMLQSVELRQGEVRVRPVPTLPRVVFGHDGDLRRLARLVAALRVPRRARARPRFPGGSLDARAVRDAPRPQHGRATSWRRSIVSPTGRRRSSWPKPRARSPSAIRGHRDSRARRTLVGRARCFHRRPGAPSRSIIAGYPWFEVWGRDSLIALPGLYLVHGETGVRRADPAAR